MCGHHISGLRLAIFIAVVRPDIWMPDILPRIGLFYCHHEARNTTPDIFPRIGIFHCRREARNMDARYLASNQPFSLPSRGLKYGRMIYDLERALFIAVAGQEMGKIC